MQKLCLPMNARIPSCSNSISGTTTPTMSCKPMKSWSQKGEPQHRHTGVDQADQRIRPVLHPLLPETTVDEPPEEPPEEPQEPEPSRKRLRVMPKETARRSERPRVPNRRYLRE